MILATWNVNSINVRLEQLIEWLKTAKPDVVCLQETKIVDEKFPQARLEELGYHSAYWGQKTYNGVAILSNKPFDEVRRGFVEEKEAYDQQQRRLIEVAIGNTYIVNVYIPNGSE
ncbi:MAG TPA: exodeoxyribonuclease III, partial [Chroococcales cyanobacterium]